MQLGHPPGRIDILTSVDGVEFEPCWEHRVEIKVGNQMVPFVSRADLIENKRASGRPQDIADVAVLEQMDVESD